MCGIFGLILDKPGDTDITRPLAMMNHRGPDDAGIMTWNVGEPPRYDSPATVMSRVAFGHRRLSIIDLTAAGRQPMASADGRQIIVFNGEVYNYLELRQQLGAEGVQFTTRTDTEVVLMSVVRWGIERAVKAFRGMFAFALLDTDAQTITVARDAFGIKPLSYCAWRDGLAFSSEVGPLLELPGVDRSLDPDRSWLYLRFGVTDHGADTMLNGIKQVAPAHWGEMSLRRGERRFRFTPYWDPQHIDRQDVSFESATTQVRELFLRNIKWHLRSDVPVGTALSGGIDSSAIVCAIRHLYPAQEIHTFSYLADEAALNEERWVDLVNKHVGAIAHPVRPKPDDLAADLERLMRCQGEPFGSTSIYAQHCVFRASAAAGIKVMLDGQGADELLGGYMQYQGARMATLIAKGRVADAATFYRAQNSWPGRRPRNVLVTALGQLLPDVFRPYARALLGRTDRPDWANLAWFKDRNVNLDCTWHHHRDGEYLRGDLQESVVVGLLSLLRYEDRNSMAYSVESRVPFLTTDFAELLLSLPEQYLIGNDGTSKRVFREAMRGIVPDAILDRRDKIGFATPELTWLRHHKQFVDAGLRLSRETACLNPHGVQRYVQRVLKGEFAFSFQPWRLLNFSHWHARLGTEN